MTLDELRQAALRATPGPWKVWGMTVMDDPAQTSDVQRCREIAVTTDPDRGLCSFNADYIAAAHPATVLKLLEIIVALRAGYVRDSDKCLRRAAEIERSL